MTWKFKIIGIVRARGGYFGVGGLNRSRKGEPSSGMPGARYPGKI